MHNNAELAIQKYPTSMRLLHWTRAVLIFGLIISGWYMTGLPEETTPTETFGFFYGNHKQFGVLTWLLALAHIAIRWKNRNTLPHTPESLTRIEKILSHVVHRLIMILVFAVPTLGYLMSATFSQSAGVPFFFFGHLPEFLPKNDNAFEWFNALHMYSAYALLALIILHVAGGIKHRLEDKNGETDVLPRIF